MNRRAFISGLLATSALRSWPVQALTQCSNIVGADLTEATLLRMNEDLRAWYLINPPFTKLRWANGEVVKSVADLIFPKPEPADVTKLLGVTLDDGEWSTGDLPYPCRRYSLPDGWRDWYGTEGL